MLKRLLLIPRVLKSSFRLPETTDFVKSFDQLDLPERILTQLNQFDAPSEIQSKSMKILMDGHDLIGISPTGSGKTLAFAIPALVKSAKINIKTRGSISTVIICPTRQLSNQIADAITPFAQELGLRTANLFGGAPKRDQFFQAKRANVIVATPGRLFDYVSSVPNRLGMVHSLILDEADRMLDLGFQQQIKGIADQTPSERQTMLFSATWEREIEIMATDYIKSDAYYVQIGNNTISLNPNIEQLFEHVSPRGAKQHIAEIINTLSTEKVLIFCNTKNETRDLAFELNDLTDRQVNYITSDLTQDERMSVMAAFREKDDNILVATDVASRGIDVKNIGLVINYGFPDNSADFIHRIGRTGRGGKSGKSLTYIIRGNPRIEKDLRYIANLYTNQNLEIPKSLQNIIKELGITQIKGRNAQPIKRFDGRRSERPSRDRENEEQPSRRKSERSSRDDEDQTPRKKYQRQSPDDQEQTAPKKRNTMMRRERTQQPAENEEEQYRVKSIKQKPKPKRNQFQDDDLN